MRPSQTIADEWSHVPIEPQALGVVLMFRSFYVGFLTLRENSHAAPTVKIQEERGHEDISTCAYRYVRHPMYAGVTLLSRGAPLLLGSWYGLALCPLVIAVLGVRAVMEERMLTQSPACRPADADQPWPPLTLGKRRRHHTPCQSMRTDSNRWPHWDLWLAERSGKLTPAPGTVRNRSYKAHAKAPGTDVPAH